jgi:FKBP-type peptidyl-prolyl cis-trans isomerase
MKAKWFNMYASIAIGMLSCINGQDSNTLFNDEIKQIDDYLISIGVADEVLYDNGNGIRVHIHEYGEEAPPHNGQTVTINYAGRLFPNGATFASGTITDKLENLTPPGFKSTVANIMTGTNVTSYIPSSRGFGEAGTTDVPPNSILVYDIYLAQTERTAIEQDQFETDSTAIANYIADNQLDLVYNDGDIWYSVQEEGTGANPIPYDVVTFDYKLSLLSDPQTIFDQGTITDTGIFTLVDGFKVGLPLLREGTKATFIIPSGLGYGPKGANGLPGNANLIYEITFTKILK